MRMSRLQMETGQIWELMVIRQRHPNPLPVEVRIRQIRDRHANIPVQKCGTRKRQPVKQQAIREILTVRPVIKNFPQERASQQKATAQKYAIKKMQPVQQQAIPEILTVRTVIKNFPQERALQQKVTAPRLRHRKQLQARTERLQPHVHDVEQRPKR